MNSTRHLTSDEIVERVFPVEDRPAAVPEHLAACAACQDRIANLREAWLLDRGAVSGAVDDLPQEFWETQAAAAMAAVRAGAPVENVRVFPSRMRGILRHPAIAFSSLAAALVLVGGLSLLRPAANERASVASTTAERTPVVASDAADDELLVSIDRSLEDSSLAGLVEEEPL
jgi:hypothetical protein